MKPTAPRRAGTAAPPWSPPTAIRVSADRCRATHLALRNAPRREADRAVAGRDRHGRGLSPSR
ncbi:hypothetical protein C5C86_02020 [Rathayibacter sp. AY1E4]|nr:hypothetical protein C5C86_02020 [Rathayibacter sp. AY1E4]